MSIDVRSEVSIAISWRTVPEGPHASLNRRRRRRRMSRFRRRMRGLGRRRRVDSVRCSGLESAMSGVHLLVASLTFASSSGTFMTAFLLQTGKQEHM